MARRIEPPLKTGLLLMPLWLPSIGGGVAVAWSLRLAHPAGDRATDG